MKKKIFLIATICLCMLGLVACGNSDPTTKDYNGKSYDELKSTCQQMVSNLQSIPEENLSMYQELTDADIEEQVKYYQENGVADVDSIRQQLTLIKKWAEAVDEYGSFVDLGEFTITKSGKTLTAVQEMKFTERNVLLTYVYTYYNMEVDDITMDAVYTTGEKMGKAGLNTVMCIAIVFLVLILISLIISCFKFLTVFENRKAKKAEAVKEDAVVTQIEEREVAQADDGELIAVIAAAIAAAEGTSTDGFVVRSIKRR